MANTDIVVVGAGPTGLTTALELASQSVAFRLVDKAEQPSTQSRALLMHARSIELLSRHGLREKLLNSGISPEGASIIVSGQEVFKVQLPNMATLFTDSAHPSPLVIHQSETERVLLDALRTKYGISPERGVTVDNIKQDDAGASLTLNGQAVRCKYIVGADGAHSVVRHSAPHMTFDGAQYPQDFILCDAEVRPGPNSRSLNRVHFCLGQGLLVLLPLDGSKMVRLVASRAGKFAAKAGKEQPTLADFQEFLDDIAPGFGTLHDPVWMTRYRLHHRGVNMYREGRLFVAGDAAHIHSPAMGQGMNTGIQDAVNLGWKLAAAVRHADTSLSSSPSPSSTTTSSELIETLLDSYHVERHPVGQKLLSSTDYAFTWFTWNNPIFLTLRNTLVPYIVPHLANRSAEKQIQTFRFMSQLGIRYAKSPIVKTGSGFEGPVRGGSRAPDGRVFSAGAGRENEEPEKWLLSQLAGNRHTLLLFSGAGAGTATERGLEAARARFAETAAAAGASTDRNGQVDVFTIYASGVTPAAHTDKAYTEAEPGNVLHERYGFQDKAGYVYLRPDLYIAHVGYLESSMDELLESLRTYL